MISMGHKQSIIIGHFQDGKSARTLSRELGLNRRTVSKYIREYRSLTSSSQSHVLSSGILDPPRYRGGSRQRTALTAEVMELLEGYEAKNAAHRAAGRHKQQMKRTDMLDALHKAGHQIGYTSVCRAIEQIRGRHQEAFIRQHYRPGEEVEFDWGEVQLLLDGRPKRLYLAVFTLAYSNHRWGMLFYRQDMVSFLTAHRAYFQGLGHVPGRVSYDNMRTAVARFVHRDGRRDKEPTDDLLRLSAYYVFDFRFCNVRRGNEKGHVERSVEYLRRKAFSEQIAFDTIEAANEHLSACFEALNRKPVRGQKVAIAERLAEECQLMRPAPAQPFDPAELTQKRVDKYGCVTVDTNHYSVPDDRVGRFVEVRLYALHLEVYDRDGSRLLARHPRHHTTHCYYIELAHFLPTLRRKPGALLGSLAWQQAEAALRQTFLDYFDPHQVKDFIEAMLWVEQQGFSWADVQESLHQASRGQAHRYLNADTLKALLLCQRQSTLAHEQVHPASTQQNAIQQQATSQLQQYQQLFSI